MAALASFALSIQPGLLNTSVTCSGFPTSIVTLVRMELCEADAAHMAIGIGLTCFYLWELRRHRRPFDRTACIVSCFFSICLVLGASFSTFFDFTFIALCGAQALIAFTVFAGYWVLLYYPVLFLFDALDAFEVGPESISRATAWVQGHALPVAMATLLVCWILQSLPFFPGSIPFDGRFQLNMFTGAMPMNLHHPFFSTLVLGSIYSLGAAVGGPNFGTASIVAVQMVAAAFVFGKICEYVCKTAGLKPAAVCLLFYTLSPMWWAYLQTVMKDTLFFVAFAYYSLEYFKILRDDHSKKDYLLLSVGAIVSCLFRNNGIYIVLPSLAALLICKAGAKHVRNCVTGVLGATLGVYAAFNIGLTGYLHLAPLNQVEAISVPLQQVARYLNQYWPEITVDEFQVIDKIVDASDMAWRYDPVNADMVKDRNRPDISSDEFVAFFKLYVRYFLTHPLPYIEAAMDHAFGYLDPTYYYYGLATYQFYQMDAIQQSDEGIVYASYVFPAALRNYAINVAYLWNKLPLASIIVSPAAYTWLIVLAFAQIVRARRFGRLPMLVAPFMSLLICFVSPVNGLLRYALPIMAATPLYILAMLPDRPGTETPEPEPLS